MKEFFLQCWYATPLQYWGMAGILFDKSGPKIGKAGEKTIRLWWNETPVNKLMPAPWGGTVESIFRRRRRCVICGKYFWRQGAFNPFRGVNIFEEHCSSACNEIDLASLPY